MKTAKELRTRYEKAIKELQETCPHKESEWMCKEIRIGSYAGQVRVCLMCEKILEDENDNI